MKTFYYDRTAAGEYAKAWAKSRNPEYYDFEDLGGDCTNFASQCIFAGAHQMNFTPTFGWYYLSLSSRAPAWTGVQYLYNFLVTNRGLGPFAAEMPLSMLDIGDVVQLGNSRGEFYHSPVVVGFSDGEILVAAHSYDVYGRPLSSYNYYAARGIHILGVRK